MEITEAQLNKLGQLADAANMLSAALPGAYTMTPLGSLADLTRQAHGVLLQVRFSSMVDDTATSEADAALIAERNADGRHPIG